MRTDGQTDRHDEGNSRFSQFCECAQENFDVCVSVHHWYNYIDSQLDATTTNFSDIYNQLNTFRAIISPILRSSRLCVQLVV